MKSKKLPISILLLFNLLAYTAADAQTAIKDLITHKVIVNYTDHTIVAYVKPSPNVRAFSNLQYYWFSGQSIQSSQGGYSGKLLNGYYEDFYANKNLKEAGWFSKGLKQGPWKSWDEKGLLKEECNWSAGQKNGIYRKYNNQGKLSQTGHYKNDSLKITAVKIMDSSKVQHPDTVRKGIVPKFIKNLFKHHK